MLSEITVSYTNQRCCYSYRDKDPECSGDQILLLELELGLLTLCLSHTLSPLGGRGLPWDGSTFPLCLLDTIVGLLYYVNFRSGCRTAGND